MITKTKDKIRVRLESFNHELLMSSCRKIMAIAQNIELKNIGITTLPTDKRIYCVLRLLIICYLNRELQYIKRIK